MKIGLSRQAVDPAVEAFQRGCALLAFEEIAHQEGHLARGHDARADGPPPVRMAARVMRCARRFVVVPDGRGYLLSSRLPAVGHDRTYQLWGIVGGSPVSLGLLGSSPRQATFTMAGARRPSRLAVTSEPAGGTSAPSGAIVAAGTV
jgi:anti-sigma-K factor RskA